MADMGSRIRPPHNGAKTWLQSFRFRVMARTGPVQEKESTLTRQLRCIEGHWHCRFN